MIELLQETVASPYGAALSLIFGIVFLCLGLYIVLMDSKSRFFGSVITILGFALTGVGMFSGLRYMP